MISVGAIASLVIIVVLGLTAPQGGGDQLQEERGGPVATIPLDTGGTSITGVVVVPTRVGRGEELRVSGVVSHIAPGEVLVASIGGWPSGSVAVGEGGRFAGDLIVPGTVATGPADVTIDLPQEGERSVEVVTVGFSTPAEDPDQATGTVPPTVEPDDPEIAPSNDAGGVGDSIEASPAPAAGSPPVVTDPGVIAAFLAVLALLVVATTLVTHRRRPFVTAGDRFSIVAIYAATRRRTARVVSEPDRGEDALLPPVGETAGGDYLVVEITEDLYSVGSTERELARSLYLHDAQRLARDSRRAHVPGPTEVERWWEIRRITDNATVWVTRSWLQREHEIDPDEGPTRPGPTGSPPF